MNVQSEKGFLNNVYSVKNDTIISAQMSLLLAKGSGSRTILVLHIILTDTEDLPHAQIDSLGENASLLQQFTEQKKCTYHAIVCHKLYKAMSFKSYKTFMEYLLNLNF